MAIPTSSSVPAPQLPQSQQTLPGHRWHHHLTLLIPILTIYFSLAFYRINHQSLWLDEVLSLMQADPEGAFLVR